MQHHAASLPGLRWRSTGCNGFTLIELLVALSVMALMALLSWRSIDGTDESVGALNDGSVAGRPDVVLDRTDDEAIAVGVAARVDRIVWPFAPHPLFKSFITAAVNQSRLV